MIGQGLSCDEKGELADEDSEDTFEEALEDKPNDENVRFDEDLLKPLCALVYFRYQAKTTLKILIVTFNNVRSFLDKNIIRFPNKNVEYCQELQQQVPD